MASLPLALSIHHFISSVGADVGFASIIGLAILVLLFFSQGRETKLLRERTEQLAEHAQYLEGQLGFLTRQRQTAEAARERTTPPVAARPAFGQAPAGAVSASRGSAIGTLAAVPAAPAGVGAPALASATKLIPTIVPSGPNGEDEDHTMLPQPAFAGAASATAQRASQIATDGPAPGGGATFAPPPPATAAAGANGASDRDWPAEPAVPFPVPAAAAGGSSTRSARPTQPPSRGSGRASAASAASARRPPSAPATQHRSTGGRRFMWLMAALAVIVIVAVVLIVMRGGGKGTPATASTPGKPATRSRSTRRAAAVQPNTVTVAVLNGTVTNGLAHQVSVRLASAGYRQGTVATDSNQTLTSSTVYYEPGHRAAALAVAKSLSRSNASVQPIDSSTQAVACPPPSPCTATVVVAVGTDLASG
jgi:hypothetical protein